MGGRAFLHSSVRWVYPNPTVALSRKTHLSENLHRAALLRMRRPASDVDDGDLGMCGGGSLW